MATVDFCRESSRVSRSGTYADPVSVVADEWYGLPIWPGVIFEGNYIFQCSAIRWLQHRTGGRLFVVCGCVYNADPSILFVERSWGAGSQRGALKYIIMYSKTQPDRWIRVRVSSGRAGDVRYSHPVRPALFRYKQCINPRRVNFKRFFTDWPCTLCATMDFRTNKSRDRTDGTETGNIS